MPIERKNTNNTKSKISLQTSSSARKPSKAKSYSSAATMGSKIPQSRPISKTTKTERKYSTTRNAVSKKNNTTSNIRKKPPSNKSKNNIRTKNNTEEIGVISVLNHIFPLILIIIAIYIFICFITHGAKENVGSVGVFVRNFFFGFFSSAAWLIPFMIINIAFFYKRDLKREYKFNKYRVIFSSLCIVLISSIKHLFTKEKIIFEVKELYTGGIESVDGGVIGGYTGHVLMIFGSVGAGIITISLLIVFMPFLLGYTPLGLVKKIAEIIRDFEKSGYVREVVVQDNTKDHGTKVTMHKYRVVSDTNLIGQKQFLHKKAKFNIDIPVNNRNFADNQSQSVNINNISTGVSAKIDSNPFVNDENQEDITVPQIKKTPQETSVRQGTSTRNRKLDAVLLPDEENETQTQSRKNKDTTRIDEIEKIIDYNKNIAPPDIDYVPIIVESAPVKRNDEPEMITSENSEGTLNVQKSKLFANSGEGAEYKLPPFSFLTKDISNSNIDISEELRVTSQKLIETLASFNVKHKYPQYQEDRR